MHNCTTYEEYQTELLFMVSQMTQNNLVLHLVDDTGEQRSKESIARMLDLIQLVVKDEGFDLAMSGDQDEMKEYINFLESSTDGTSTKQCEHRPNIE